MTSSPSRLPIRGGRASKRIALVATAASLATVAVATGPRPVGPDVSLAHTSITSKRPAQGTTAKTNITLVAVVFGGAVRSARLTVTGPGGKKVSGTTVRDKNNKKRFSTALSKRLKPGSYRAKVTFSAGDAHRQSQSWTFKLVK